MKTTTNTYVVKSETGQPQAWIAIKRNRQKIYNGQGKFSQVYLKDGQEFQIELYNPTQTRYLAKIKINGNYTSVRGLILNPGQRYFLDRFIDENRRLVFSTYNVDNNEEVKKAIEKNGIVEVEFYSEASISFGSIWTYPSKPSWGDPYWYTTNGTLNLVNGSSNGTLNLVNRSSSTTLSVGGNITYTADKNPKSFNNYASYSSVVNDQSIETGRVEKGEKSDQNFEDGYGTFNAWSSYTTKVQIIPISQKPVESQEIRSYCTGCGSRIKKQTWKFCPNCGTETI